MLNYLPSVFPNFHEMCPDERNLNLVLERLQSIYHKQTGRSLHRDQPKKIVFWQTSNMTVALFKPAKKRDKMNNQLKFRIEFF